MTASNYDEALKRLLMHEGGYTDQPGDPGGPTNFGITIHDYRKYINPAGTAAMVRAMSLADAKTIYRQRYADVIEFDQLPAGVDYSTFDYAVHSGPSRAAKVLQRIVNVAVDGEIGPETLAAAQERDPKVVVNAMCDERMVFLRGLKNWNDNKNGWTRRVAEVRTVATTWAGRSQSVVPSQTPLALPGRPPWLARQDAIMGLYEFPGGADNPAILQMARACGGQIARTYKHDSIPWCALDVNYVLIASGFPGNDSLWALDFQKYGRLLPGPAVGAIASQKRSGGGHVYLVVGRTHGGDIIGRGGNQRDMVCDEIFPAQDPSRRYTWPSAYPLPTNPGFVNLPIVVPAPKAHKNIVLPPPGTWTPGKGVVEQPKVGGKVSGGAAAGGGAATITWWDWVAAHPWEAGLIAAGGAMAVGSIIYAVRRHYAGKQDAPTPGLVPVAA